MLKEFDENRPITLPTPAERTTVPTVMSRNFLRQNAVEDKDRMCQPGEQHGVSEKISGLINSLYTAYAMPAPMPKVKIIPATTTVVERRAFLLITSASTSRPTSKRNRQNPIFVTIPS